MKYVSANEFDVFETEIGIVVDGAIRSYDEACDPGIDVMFIPNDIKEDGMVMSSGIWATLTIIEGEEYDPFLYISRIDFETETIHPIDPKFIPALDSITLNGADGKQYKVAVDETGALTATAIE